jgi:hypothetical protein
LILGLFNNDFSIAWVVTNGKEIVNYELERLWKEVAQHVCGGTEENHKLQQDTNLVPNMKYEAGVLITKW